jgi:hypothetical protein
VAERRAGRPALIRQYRPDAIWSTYPIATAHLIALTLQKLSGLPWIADQRDPMLDDSDPLAPYPPEPRLHRMHAWIEQRIAARSAPSSAPRQRHRSAPAAPVPRGGRTLCADRKRLR